MLPKKALIKKAEGWRGGGWERWRREGNGGNFFCGDSGGLRFGVEDAVLVEDLLVGDCGDAVAGDDDAGEVHGIGGSYRDDGGAVAGAGGAEGFDGFGESVLFAAEAGEEAAAADFAAGFETAENVEEVAPSGGVGFAGEEVAEEDAVTGE